MRAGFPRRRDEAVTVSGSAIRRVVVAVALVVGGAGYVALPSASATLPSASATLPSASATLPPKVLTGSHIKAAFSIGSVGTAATDLAAMSTHGDAMSMTEEVAAPHWMRLLVRVGWVLSIELPLIALILLWRRRREVDGIVLRAFSILMLAGVAITHASDWLDKLQEATYIAVGFGLLIAGSGLCAIAIATWRRTRWPDALAGWMSALTIVGYLYSRAIGLPEIADHVGRWADAWGNASLVVEAALVVVALRGFLPQRLRDWRPLDPALSKAVAHLTSPPTQRGIT